MTYINFAHHDCIKIVEAMAEATVEATVEAMVEAMVEVTAMVVEKVGSSWFGSSRKIWEQNEIWLSVSAPFFLCTCEVE